MDDYHNDQLLANLRRHFSAVSSHRGVTSVDFGSLSTSVGKVRASNQDRVVLMKVSYDSVPTANFILGALSDGIGGLDRGDVAASLTLSVFLTKIIRRPRIDIYQRLYDAACDANVIVHDELRGRSGATLSACVISADSRIHCLNVGDSRIYAVSSKHVSQCSVDDTFGRYAPADDIDADLKNRLVQYVGMGAGFEPNRVDVDGVDASYMLLTSDGVHGIGTELFSGIVKMSCESTSNLVDSLVEISTALAGNDNASALALSLKHKPFSACEVGTRISVASPFRELEIWYPRVNVHDRKVERPADMPAAKDAPGADLPGADLATPSYNANQEPDQAERKTVEKPNKVSRATNRRRPKNKKNLDQPLPLEEPLKPRVDIEFPKEASEEE